MKARNLVTSLATLLAVSSLGLLGSVALANSEDFERCGTPYPGWWKHVQGPESLVSLVSVTNVSINQAVGAQGVFDVDVTNKNVSNKVTPRMPLALTFAMGDGSVMPNPDDPFDPNNPGNPYAVIGYQAIDRVLIGLLKPGEMVHLAGTRRTEYI